MDKPTIPSTDYAQGQMMGMLVICMLLEEASDSHTPIPMVRFETIKKVAVESLEGYLKIPQEDVILLVQDTLRKIP